MGTSMEDLKNKIINGEPQDVDTWEDYSPDAKDFVLKCLVKDPEARPTAQEMLEHPWL